MNGDLRHWQNYSHLKGFIIPFYGILGCCSDILCLLCSKTRQASTSLYCGFHHFRPYFLKLDKWIKAVCCRLCIYFLVEFIAERKLMSYVIGVILCSLIHRSALLLLPFIGYLINRFISKQKLQSACSNCLYSHRVNSYVATLDKLCARCDFWVGYDDYASRLTNIINKTNEAIAWGPSRVGLYVLDLMALYLYPKFQEKYQLGKRYDIYFSAFS